MSCEMKTLKLYRGYPSRFNFQNWLNVSFNTEIFINGWGARFELENIVKTYENVQDGFSINLSAEETQGLPNGLLNGSIILVDLEGNDHPFLTALPVLVSDWVEGDIEEDGFNYEIKVDIQENELIINIKSGSSSSDVDEKIIGYINLHNNNEEAHPFIQGLIETESQARDLADQALAQSIQDEATTRENADTALGNRIDTEEQARIDEDEALDQRIDEVVGDLDDHIQDKENPHEVTKAQVGLGNVDNTSDMNKPVSTAQENAIQAVQDNLDDETDARLLSEQGLQDQIDEKQPTISDLDTIRSNASAGKSASDTIETYGNIVTHNTYEFATAGQGAKADTALQPSDLSATSPIAYNSSTKTISVASGYQIPTTTQVGKIGTNEIAIATINSKIPSEATSSNQLADKAFVNSTVGTNTSNYISNNGQPFTSLAQLQAYTGTVTNNDYAFITGTDEEGNTFYDRYKATVTGTTVSWAKEYRLNNSSFTASQWASIQSGITSDDVELIGTALQPQDNISELTNDAGYITGISSSDVTGALGYTPYNSTNPNNYISRSGISATSPIAYNNSTGIVSVVSGYQIPTTTQITTFTNKQDALVSGTNIKTINSTSILGNGNISVATSAQGAKADSAVQNLSDLSITATATELNVLDGITATTTELNYVDGVTSNIQTQLNGKQPTLSSGTNIKTINGNSVLGSGNLEISGLPSQSGQSGKYLTTNGSTASWATVDALPSQSGQSGKFLTTNGTSASWSEVNVKPKTFNILDFKWSDHELNDQNWLNSSTFSWQSGTVYSEAYNHLVADITGKTLQSETIGSTTIQFYLADDGHKICPVSQENNVSAIYTEIGISWYYIVDTTNTRFKLPRTKYGFNGLRDAVGKYIPDGLPELPIVSILNHTGFPNGSADTGSGTGNQGYWRGWEEGQSIVKNDNVYGKSDVVQQRATQMYLYFYVGEFSQSATEQTAGITTEQLNAKVDVASLKECHTVIETYHNVTEWYRLYDDGWIEQGGLSASTAPKNITLLKEMADPNYFVSMCVYSSTQNADTRSPYVSSKTTTGFVAYIYNNNTVPVYWEVKGYVAL